MTEFNPKSNLVKNTRMHLKFLEEVNNQQNLHERNAVLEAVYRYEKFWLVLASKHPEELLIPPFDIQWVWYVHMLAPKSYEKDCKAVVGGFVDTRFTLNSKEAVAASKLARQYWTYAWPDETFDLELDRDWSSVTPRTCNSKISYDLPEAIKKQKDFYIQVSMPHYKDAKFLEDALTRYKKFLRLNQLKRDGALTPCYDIHVIWHTHLREPRNYAEETREYLGVVLDHNDTVNDCCDSSNFDTSYQHAKELWMESFEDSLSKEGCMSRGVSSTGNSNFSIVSTLTPFNCTANKYSISLMKMELSNCQERSFSLAVYKRYRYSEDKKVLRRSGGTSKIWSGNPPTGIKNFSFDSSKCSHLFLVLKRSQGFSCFRETEVMGRNHLHFFNNPETDYSCSHELNYDVPLTLVDDGQSVANVQLKMTRFPLKRGPLVLRVQQAPFSYLANPPADIWGPVSLPMTNPARPELPHNVYTATHRLVTHHGKVAYKVELIHGVEEGMSAVLVRNGSDGELTCEAHLIGPDQLPLRYQLEKPERCVFLSDQRTERAMLIRDAKGDWGVCVGRWAAYSKTDTNNRPTLEKKVGKKNPGFLNLRFYHLRRNKMTRIYLPTREKNSMSFCFDFNLDHVYVDMEDGHLIVSKHSEDHAQNVALGFSVCVLFSLCQPYPLPDTTASPRHQITVNTAFASTSQYESISTNIQPLEFPKEANRSLPKPRFKPSDWRTVRKKSYSNDVLVMSSAVGYWYYNKYPVYYEAEMSSDFHCRDHILVWDEERCEGDFTKGVDDSDDSKDEDMEEAYDNDLITLEEFMQEEGVHMRPQALSKGQSLEEIQTAKSF